MSIIMADTCGDGYSDILSRWEYYSVPPLSNGITGGISGNCLYANRLGGLSNGFIKLLPADHDSVSLGVHVKIGDVSNETKIISLGKSPAVVTAFSAAIPTFVSFTYSGSGIPKLYGPAGELLAVDESGFFVHPGVWYHIELRAEMSWHSTTGGYNIQFDDLSLYIDGRLACQLTNAMTSAVIGTNDGIDAFELRGCGADTYFDNLVITDGDVVGPMRVGAFRPSADGAHSDYTPNSGSTHYNRVNESAPDGSSTYVESETVGHKDTWAFPDVDAAITDILGGDMILTMAGGDNGDTFAALARLSSTDYRLAVHTYGGAKPYRAPFTSNPDTSAPFTTSEFNGAEFGAEVVTS